MLRQARIDALDALHHHIVARGIEHGKIFRDDQDENDCRFHAPFARPSLVLAGKDVNYVSKFIRNIRR